jgi:hypothetical protein
LRWCCALKGGFGFLAVVRLVDRRFVFGMRLV